MKLLVRSVITKQADFNAQTQRGLPSTKERKLWILKFFAPFTFRQSIIQESLLCVDVLIE